ncbi:MAG: response regulator, partial [Acidobacteriota bacterium]|nr:response regulator [Acidobacteriota bacterium]
MKTEFGEALVVDDEVNLRESLVELIAGEGFRVAQASNGEEAVESLRKATVDPDVVFLDVRMPKMDGLEVLRVIQEEKLTSAPVIVLSAFGDSSKMIAAMRLGAYDYLTKPLDLDEIVATLRRAVEQRRLGRAAELARPAKDVAGADGIAADPNAFEMLGTSRVMRDVFKQIGRVAGTD